VTDNASGPLRQMKEFWPVTLALMLIGMAGFRSGFLSGAWSRRSYRIAALLGIGIGLTAFSMLALITILSGYAVTQVSTGFALYSEPFGPLMALGYAALIILLMNPGGWLTTRFAAVGRAAFTNYLASSIIGVLVFVGPLHLYGRVSRAEAWLLVPVTWLLMLGWSKPWLDRFRYGPFEWLWRSLAQARLQPMRILPTRPLPETESAAQRLG
jgi:uncharacterized protein